MALRTLKGGLLLPPLFTSAPTVGLLAGSSKDIEPTLLENDQSAAAVVIEFLLGMQDPAYFTDAKMLVSTVQRRLSGLEVVETYNEILQIFIAAKGRFTELYWQQIMDVITNKFLSVGAVQAVVQTDIREVLTFSSDDVRAVYHAINRAEHNDFSVDPGFLIHRIKSAFTRDIEVARDPTPSELREVVEFFRTRFEGDFGARIDQLLSEEASAKDKEIESGLSNDPPSSQVDTAGDLPLEFFINPVFIAHVTSAVRIFTIVSRIFDEVHSQLQRNPTAKEVFAILRQIEIEGHFPLGVKVSLQDKTLVLRRIRLELPKLISEYADTKELAGEECDDIETHNDDSSDQNLTFNFDVDPDLDLAIGTELSLDEAEGEFALENFAEMGIDPLSPTGAKPGSEEKVRVLAARYAAGVMNLWHLLDCYDQGPKEDEEEEEDELEDVHPDDRDDVPAEEL